MGSQKRHSGKKRIYDGSRRSAAARAMFHLAVAFYRLGLALAVLSLMAAASVVAAIPEPLGHRLVSVVFFGGIPSLAAWLGGWLVYLILNYASAACDDYISPIKTASGQLLLANAGGTRVLNGWNALKLRQSKFRCRLAAEAYNGPLPRRPPLPTSCTKSSSPINTSSWPLRFR